VQSRARSHARPHRTGEETTRTPLAIRTWSCVLLASQAHAVLDRAAAASANARWGVAWARLTERRYPAGRHLTPEFGAGAGLVGASLVASRHRRSHATGPPLRGSPRPAPWKIGPVTTRYSAPRSPRRPLLDLRANQRGRSLRPPRARRPARPRERLSRSGNVFPVTNASPEIFSRRYPAVLGLLKLSFRFGRRYPVMFIRPCGP
jgi:hypothetical protein